MKTLIVTLTAACVVSPVTSVSATSRIGILASHWPGSTSGTSQRTCFTPKSPLPASWHYSRDDHGLGSPANCPALQSSHDGRPLALPLVRTCGVSSPSPGSGDRERRPRHPVGSALCQL